MKTRVILIYSLTFLVLLFTNCKKKEKDAPVTPTPTTPTTPSPLPSIVTSPISNITDSTAVSGGTVISEGASAITAVGICWDTLPTPTTLKNKTNNGAGIGTYISKLTGLKVNKTYYVRAYATNANGTAYGEEISFASPVIKSWTKSSLPNSIEFLSITSNGATIYAGTSTGIQFSSDSGNTWVAKGLEGKFITRVYQKGTSLFAISQYTELYRSQDNGNTWTSLTGNFPYSVNIKDITGHNNKLIAATDSSAFYSIDDGNSWTRTNSGLPPPVPAWQKGGAVYNAVSSGPQVYVIAGTFEGPGIQPTLYKYNEASDNWTFLSIYPQGVSIDIDVSGNNVLLSRSILNVSDLSISFDGGNNWSTINSQHSTFIDVEGASVFLSNSAKNFSVSFNYGSTWTPIPKQGLPPTTYDGFITPYYLFLNTANGIYKFRYN